MRSLLYATALSIVVSTPYYTPLYAQSGPATAVTGVNGNINSSQGGGGGGGGGATPCLFTGPGTGILDGCAGAITAWNGSSTVYNAVSTILAFNDPIDATHAGLLGDGTVFQTPYSCTQSGNASPLTSRAANTCAGIAAASWNIPGEEFAVGALAPGSCPASTHCSTTPGATTLLDASDAVYWNSGPALTATGCASIETYLNGTLETTGQINLIECDTPNGTGHTVNLTNIDWSPNEGSGGGKTETCVDLVMRETSGNNGASGTINFTHNHWHMLNHTGCTDVLTAQAGQFRAPFQYFPNGTTDAWNININNNAFNQDGTQAFATYALFNLTGQWDARVYYVTTGGAVTAEYNYFLNFASRILDTICTGGTTTSSGGVLFAYNLIHNQQTFSTTHWNWGLQFTGGGHLTDCPTVGGASTMAFNRSINNIFYNDVSLTNGYGATASISLGYSNISSPNGIINSMQIDENVVELNQITSNRYYVQANLNVSSTLGGTFTPVVGDVLQINAGAISCTVQPVYVVDGSTTADPLKQGRCPSGTSSPGPYAATCIGHIVDTAGVYTLGACSGSYSAVTITIGGASLQWQQVVAGSGVVMGAGASTTHVNSGTVRNNMVDGTSPSVFNAFVIAPTGCSAAITISNNFNPHVSPLTSNNPTASGSGC